MFSTLAMSIERYIAVIHPFAKYKWATVKKSLKVCYVFPSQKLDILVFVIEPLKSILQGTNTRPATLPFQWSFTPSSTIFQSFLNSNLPVCMNLTMGITLHTLLVFVVNSIPEPSFFWRNKTQPVIMLHLSLLLWGRCSLSLIINKVNIIITSGKIFGIWKFMVYSWTVSWT